MMKKKTKTDRHDEKRNDNEKNCNTTFEVNKKKEIIVNLFSKWHVQHAVNGYALPSDKWSEIHNYTKLSAVSTEFMNGLLTRNAIG